MNRKALIIACPNEKGVSSSLPLPGTKEDANKTESFLLSSAGGGWYASEVRKIIDPTKAVVTEHLKWLYGADYALSFFTGHGGTNTANNKVHLELMDGDILEENLIVAEKQTIIVDTCRTYFTPTKEMLKFADSVGEGVLSIPDARKLYDSAIDYAEPGDPIFLHAASVGQPASAGPDGSYYLLSLLNAAKRLIVEIMAHLKSCMFMMRI